MAYEEKRQKALAELEAKGVRKSQAWPLLFRLAHELGFKVPPPLYASPISFALIHSSFYVAIMFLVLSMIKPEFVALNLGTAVFSGILFALTIGIRNKRVQKNLQLTPWDEL